MVDGNSRDEESFDRWVSRKQLGQCRGRTRQDRRQLCVLENEDAGAGMVEVKDGGSTEVRLREGRTGR